MKLFLTALPEEGWGWDTRRQSTHRGGLPTVERWSRRFFPRWYLQRGVCGAHGFARSFLPMHDLVLAGSAPGSCPSARAHLAATGKAGGHGQTDGQTHTPVTGSFQRSAGYSEGISPFCGGQDAQCTRRNGSLPKHSIRAGKRKKKLRCCDDLL